MSVRDDAIARNPPPSSALIVVILVGCISVCYGFGISLFSQIVPDMRADLGFDYAFVGTVTALVQFANVVFAIAGAWLSPRIGPAQLVIASVCLCGICLLAIPLSGNVMVIGALLTVMGGTGAAAFIQMIDLVSRTVSKARRGFVMSVISSAPAYGVVANSVLVPNLAGNGNWQGVWYVVGGLAMTLVVIGSIVFHRAGLFRPHMDEDESVSDPIGNHAGGRGISSALPWVVLVFLLSFINGFAPYPFLGFMSAYLREEIGYSVSFAGGQWGTIGVVGIFAGFLAGGIATRFGMRAAILCCYVSFVIAGAIMAFAPTPELSILAGALFSFGFYPIYGLLPAYVSHRTSAAVTVSILGLSTVIGGLGGTTGNYLAGLVPTHTGSFSGIYLAFAVTGIVAVGLTLGLKKLVAGAGQA